MADNFGFTIENEEAFKRRLDALGKETSDFRIPFRLIASDFYRSQKKLFTLQSTGLYAPLGGLNFATVDPNGRTRRRNAEDEKERRTKHPWAPILYGETGDLRDSTLSRSHRYSIFNLGRKELEIGTSVPYGKYHQSGTSKMARRMFIFIDGGPADRSQDASIAGRRERWISIVDEHLKQLVEGSV